MCIKMSTPKEKKKKDFLKKHPPMSPAEIKKAKKETEKSKENYAVTMASIEQALTEYMEIRDPIKYNGKVIMLVRRPTMKELQALIPKDIGPFIADPSNVSDEELKKYDQLFYGSLASLIVVPKRTAEEWAKTATPWLLRLFFEHINRISKVMEGEAEGF